MAFLSKNATFYLCKNKNLSGVNNKMNNYLYRTQSRFNN